MFLQADWNLWVDIALLAVPVLVVLVFVFKFVLPKKPLLGIGLILGTGLLGSWLVRRKLRAARDLEEELAAHNKMMAAFRDKQDKRAQAVMANNEIITTLKKERQKLQKDAGKYETELQVLDAELHARQKLNENLLDESGDFLSASEKRSAERKKLLAGLVDEAPEPLGNVNSGASGSSDIEINGCRLIKVE